MFLSCLAPLIVSLAMLTVMFRDPRPERGGIP
jgi:hypothetical protein